MKKKIDIIGIFFIFVAFVVNITVVIKLLTL